MQISENQKPNEPERKYCVRIPLNINADPRAYVRYQFIEVSKEVYYAYYRPIWRTRERAKADRHGGCGCKDWRICPGDCWTCKFHTGGDTFSLDKLHEDIGDAAEAAKRNDAPLPNDHHNPYRRIEPITPITDQFAHVLDRMVYGDVADRIKALSEEERSICECILLDLTEREAAERLGLSKTTFHDRKEKLFKRLRTEWADLL